MKRFFTLALVLVFGTFVASAQAGSKGSSSQHSSSHNSSSNNNSSHCDHNNDHCHDTCHNGCGRRSLPQPALRRTRSDSTAKRRADFQSSVVAAARWPRWREAASDNSPGRLSASEVDWPDHDRLWPQACDRHRDSRPTVRIPTLGTGFRGLAGAVGTEVGKGVSGVLNAAGDVVGGAASAVGSVVGGVAGAVGDVASGIGSALSDLNPF